MECPPTEHKTPRWRVFLFLYSRESESAMQKKLIGIIILLLISFAAHPQKLIRGFVIDSASFAPLSYVNIKIKSSTRGTSSDGKGAFSLATVKGDTLVFSLVGYNPEEFTAAELDETIIIRMAIKIRELSEIIIIGRKEKVVRPIHMIAKSKMANYGPYGAGINLAYFSKLEKEKRKLIKVREAHDRVKNYITVVCDPEIKEKICSEYSLTNDEYFQLLAKFNIENLNNAYDRTTAEWITVLREYYAENVFKK
jgi:CarboxypepD_reg-like domain